MIILYYWQKTLEHNHIESDMMLGLTSAAKSTVDFIGRKFLLQQGNPLQK
ncbi:hypothetical protein HMPREF6745_1839 [Prevotella sp. oral taxon 472 str. F0295]|nr:hypothetical protein HMPREF6745_1839 [Prevotella sp. oral taxon 472 str. F0295]